jgi:hypothetical protein
VAPCAEIKVVDNNVLVETDAYKVQFTDGVITHLYNKLTEETYTLPLGIGGVTGFRGRSGLLRRNVGSVWTDQATLTEARKIAPLKAEIVFRQGQNEFCLFIGVDARSEDLLIEQEGTSDTAGVYGIQWGCVNLNSGNLDLILPADGGQIINAMAPFTFRSFHYPFPSWEVQLAILQGEQGGFFVRGADETFQFKVLHYEKHIDSFALGFETQNQAPFDTLTSAKSVVWRLSAYSGDWRVPARQYREWMEQTFKPWRLDEMPAWVENIGLVVIYHSLDTNLLDKLAEQIDPTKTLLYVVGWRKNGYDQNYPDYTARPEFGGFVKSAHQHGFRVMPHANLVGVSPYHSLYRDLQRFQFRAPWNGNLQGWRWERTHAPYRHAYINLASSAFRNHFVQQLREVWEKYQVDAFHLDISHIVVNDANGLIEGLTAAQGNVLMHEELAEAMPGVVFSGEHLHEVTFFRESFAQRWELPWGGKPHPISSFLFSLYTLPYGHLGTPNVEKSSQLYQKFLGWYERWGVLPTFPIWSVEDLEPEQMRIQKLLSIARTWQQFGLKPDFETDWAVDTLFQYVGKDGEIATLKTTDGGATFDLPLDEVGYERVFGVTQVKTDRSLPHWHAYNEEKILGLDPKQSYFLNDTPRDFSRVHINSLPEGVSVTESRVTENAALFRLERSDVSHEIDLLSQFHLVKTGIVFNGNELPRQKGAAFHPTEDSISGVPKSTIDAHPPYQGISGEAFGEWELSLPEGSRISLDFYIGLAEGSESSDGVTFIVAIQGTEVFRDHYNQQKWKHINLNLTPYQGQQVKLRFTTNPGPNANTSWDWARWGEPKIVSEPPEALTEVGFFLPNEPIKSFPDTVRLTGQGQYVLETELPTQILFLFESGQRVVPPYNLRDAEFVVGLQFDNIFRLGNVYGSGTRSHGTVGGMQKETIDAHPPDDGQTILQFLLSLPQAEELTFSFLFGLLDEEARSDGVTFEVLLNGQKRFERFTNTPGWIDEKISFSELVGEVVLLELVTDSGKNDNWDWAYWADLLITAEDTGLAASNRTAGANQSVQETKFLPNYPNPFNPETWIPYQLAEAADVSVNIYDVSGRLVRKISVGFKPIGYYLTRERAAYWDGRNATGEPVSSGVYFLQFIAGDFSATQRIVVLK